MHKLTISLIAVVVVTVIGLGWAISQYYDYHISKDPERLDEFSHYESLGQTLANTLDRQPEMESFVDTWSEQGKWALTIEDSENLPLPAALAKTLQDGKPLVLETDNDITLYFYLQQHGQVLSMHLPEAFRRAEKAPVNLMLTLIFYIGIVLVVLIWLSPLIRRLRMLSKAAVSFGAGELEARVKLSPISYIADIEREFNRMADRIQTLVNDNKLLGRAVSHDLKTPLARLRFGIETVAESDDPEQRERYHQRIENDLDEMEQLVETLLQFARLDESNISLAFESLDLSKLVKKVADQHVTTNKVIAIGIEGRGYVNGDKKYLSMLINNVVQNAVDHSDQKISLTVQSESNRVIFKVDDDGLGIPEEERENVVKPFVRGQHAGERKGHGMGLAIVSRIADWHHAQVDINDSETLGGAQVSITFNAETGKGNRDE